MSGRGGRGGAFCANGRCPAPSPQRRRGFHCNDEGTTSDPGWLSRYQSCTGDSDSCYFGCAANPACTSFAYNENNNFCRLFSKTINQKGFQPASTSTGIFHWNLKGCFNVPAVCTTTPPADDPPNLLANPSFEETDASDTAFVANWFNFDDAGVPYLAHPANPSNPTDGISAQDGTNYIQLQLGHGDSTRSSVHQTVGSLDTSGATWYSLTFFYRADEVSTADDPCDLKLTVGGLEPALIPVQGPLQGWGQLTQAQMVPDAADMDIRLEIATCGANGGHAMVSLDNWVFTGTPAPVAAAGLLTL